MGEDEGASAETKAHDLSSRQEEDRSGCTCTLGEVQSGEEEIGGLAAWGAYCVEFAAGFRAGSQLLSRLVLATGCGGCWYEMAYYASYRC
jgi:hypothetical protein